MFQLCKQSKDLLFFFVSISSGFATSLKKKKKVTVSRELGKITNMLPNIDYRLMAGGMKFEKRNLMCARKFVLNFGGHEKRN